MHELSSFGEFLIWQSIPNLPNRQIKNLAKVSRYTVCTFCIAVMQPLGAGKCPCELCRGIPALAMDELYGLSTIIENQQVHQRHTVLVTRITRHLMESRERERPGISYSIAWGQGFMAINRQRGGNMDHIFPCTPWGGIKSDIRWLI